MNSIMELLSVHGTLIQCSHKNALYVSQNQVKSEQPQSKSKLTPQNDTTSTNTTPSGFNPHNNHFSFNPSVKSFEPFPASSASIFPTQTHIKTEVMQFGIRRSSKIKRFNGSLMTRGICSFFLDSKKIFFFFLSSPQKKGEVNKKRRKLNFEFY
jgi:hypothetical protein